MTTVSRPSSYKNLSLCVYIGNTALFDDQTIVNYCSRFGTIVSSLFDKLKFSDFHIIEFANHEQLQSFLNINIHEIDRTVLDVKSYKHLLTNNDILNIDRKFFIGPILNSNDITTIVEFYKILDATLHYYLSEQDKQAYLLFEFNNRQSITGIFEKQTIPITTDHRKFYIHKPVHPKQFVNKIISMKNKQNQIYIHGLTDNTTETMLIDYFNKRATVVACHILLNDRKYAVIEFNDKSTVGKILDTSSVRLQGANLSVKKMPRHLASLLSSDNDNNDSDDDDLHATTGPKTSSTTNTKSPLLALPSTYQQNIFQQQQSTAIINSILSHIDTEPILIPSPENNESGWTSPPRTIITDCSPIDQTSMRSPSKPCATTASISNDPTYRLVTLDTDIKPFKNISSSSTSRFLEQVQNELDQIKDEYTVKFEKDRKYIEQEIDLLINEERQTLDKLDGYLNDHRRRVDKRMNNKRKYSPSSSNH